MLTPETTQPASGPELTNNSAGAAPAKAGNFDEQDTIVRILEEAKGRVGGANGAAVRLGLKRTTLISRMKKLGIDARRVPDAKSVRGRQRFAALCAARRRGQLLWRDQRGELKQ
jgi:hypothetical protein